MLRLTRAVIAFAACLAPLGGCVYDRVSPQDGLRFELEARYARLAEAIGRNDYVGILAVQDAAFVSVNPNGDVSDYKNMADSTRRMVDAVDTVLLIQNQIRALRVTANDAVVVEVCQQFSRMQRIGDGNLHRVDTSVLQTETWVRRSDGWRRSRIEGVHGTRWFVDGVRIDSTRPYSPGAPAYQPENEEPTNCGIR